MSRRRAGRRVSRGTTGCPWCAGSEADSPDPELLCRTHQAEYEGLSVAALDRRDAAEAADLRDMHS